MDRKCSFSVASAVASRNHPRNLPCQCTATAILFRRRSHRWNENSGVESGNAIETMFLRLTEGSDLVEIVAGERRWRAAKNVLGDDYDKPVKILEVGDTDADAIALIENFHRADLSVAEEAKAAQRQLYRNNGDK